MVLAARLGDGSAFTALYVRYERRLLRLCGRLLGDPLQAEEVAQEAALEALIGLPRLVAPERFGAWLLAIAAHRCRHRLRSPARRVVSFDALKEAGAVPELEAAEWDPVTSVETADLANVLAQALTRLPPGQRQAVELVYVRGFTLAETAMALGITVGAVKARLHKGRLALRRQLQGEPSPLPLSPRERGP